MGRFYKTSSANPMDYMYRIPAEMMMKVMQGNEMQIQDILNTTDLYDNTILKVPHLTQHNEKMKEKQKYYNDKTTGISKAILEDPVAWRKYQTTIKDIGRELQEDMLTGDLSKIQGSYNTLQEQLKKNQELAKKGMKGGVGYNDKELEMITQAQLNNWKGFNDKGEVEQLKLEGGTETYNFAEYLPNLLKEMKASGELSKISGGDDLWIQYQTNGWEGIDKQKVLQVLNEKLMSNVPFWQSISQRDKLGLPGYSGITPDKLIKQVKVKDKDGKERIVYEPYDNALSYGIFGAADAKSYMKTKNMVDIESNPYGIIKQNFENSVKKEEKNNLEKLAEYYESIGENEKAEEVLKELAGINTPILTDQNNPDFNFVKDIEVYNTQHNSKDKGDEFYTTSARLQGIKENTLATLSSKLKDPLISDFIGKFNRVGTIPRDYVENYLTQKYGPKVIRQIGQGVDNLRVSKIIIGPREQEEMELNKFVKEYNKEQHNQYKLYNKDAKTKVESIPVKQSMKGSVVKQLNENLEYYNDYSSGSPVPLNNSNKVEDVFEIMPVTPSGLINYKVKMKDNSIKIITTNKDDINLLQTNRNLALASIDFSKNGDYRLSLEDLNYANLHYNVINGIEIKNKGYKKTIVNTNDGPVEIKLMSNSPTVIVRNPKTNKEVKYPSLLSYYKLNKSIYAK
jgi:hypothetical protein